MEFLESKGKLDEFVDAKKLGQDAIAKWCLLDSAKHQLDRIDFKKHIKSPRISKPTSIDGVPYVIGKDNNFVPLSGNFSGFNTVRTRNKPLSKKMTAET